MANSLLRRPRITLVVLVLISFTMLSISYRRSPSVILSAKGILRGFVTPIRIAASDVFDPVYNVLVGAFDYSKLKANNVALMAKVSSLENQRYLDQGANASMSALSKEMHISYFANAPSIPSMVISVTPTNLQLSIELDKGSKNGIRVGNPVVDAGGLVGRVIQVSSSTSTVLLLSDPNFSAGVRFGKSGQIGLAVGQGTSDQISVQLVDPGTVLYKGEPMFTSGLQGEIFPAGIPVGRVVQAYTPPGGLEERVELSPLAPLSSLSFVSVLDWLPPTS